LPFNFSFFLHQAGVDKNDKNKNNSVAYQGQFVGRIQNAKPKPTDQMKTS
jgi:hypothetical protein